jgi:formin 2
MSGSSSSLPPHGAEVSSSRRPQAGGGGGTKIWARAPGRRPPPPPPPPGRPPPPPPRGGGGQDYGPELTSGAPPLEWTRGWFAPVQRPAGRTLSSCRGLRPVKPILQKGRSSGRCPPASSMTARTAPTPTPRRGVGHGGDRRTRH